MGFVLVWCYIIFMRWLWPLLLLTFPAYGQLNDMPVISGAGQAIEGDMLSVNGGLVKLWGVDAPDTGQKCQSNAGQEYDCFESSRAALDRYINGRTVECHIRGKDSFGQPVGTCGVAGLDLAALMVRGGWALAFQRLAPEYAQLEGMAQGKRAGLWAGIVEPPWDWRSKNSGKKR
jgi:endonuclease YncB( thermonuclease family)